MANERTVRSCIGCRRRRPPDALVRITDGDPLVVDGPSSGRGAWLCRDVDGDVDGIDRACLDRALRQDAFARSWRRRMAPGERERIRQQLSEWTVGTQRSSGSPRPM